MKPATQVKQSVRRYYRAFEEYSRTVHGLNVTITDPKVMFLPGRGWEINGHVYKEKYQDIVQRFADCAQQFRVWADGPRMPYPC